MVANDESWTSVAQDAAALLRYQSQDLGLRAIPGTEALLQRVVAPEAPATALADPSAHAAATAPTQPSLLTQTAPHAAIQASAAPETLAQVVGGDPAAALAAIRADIGDCTRCKLCKGRTNIVFGVGNPKAKLMFVGEGPGRDEDLQAEPFVGEAGKLLNRMILAMGLKRSDVYIANIVKCRPPKNRDPEPDEVAACEPFLRQQIAAIRPDYLVALGRYAAQTVLRDKTAISRMRGKWREYEGIPLMPTFHPAYLLRNPADKRLVWQDLQDVMQRLGLQKPAPQK